MMILSGVLYKISQICRTCYANLPLHGLDIYICYKLIIFMVDEVRCDRPLGFVRAL